MVSPQTRLRRLQADYASMQQLVADSDLITFTANGQPPDRYVVTYRCKGLVKHGTRVQVSEHHQVEIALHQQYPDTAPQLRHLTPIFHPNFQGAYICINAHDWTPRESLVDLVLRLGNMIVYRNYNPGSPLDPEAAQWAQRNQSRFPLDERGWLRDLSQDGDLPITILSDGSGVRGRQSPTADDDIHIEILSTRHAEDDFDIRIL